MNYEKKITIKKNVIDSYFRIYKEYLIDIIKNDVNNSIKIKLSDEEYIYVNLYDEEVIVFNQKYDCIYDINTVQYGEFISDKFLEKFRVHIEELPIRIKNILNNKHRFRMEIIENIKMNKITIFYNCKQKKLLANWKSYGIIMHINDKFEFEAIELRKINNT